MSKTPRHPDPSPRRAAAGFTLVELMISVAIVLVLMLGINYVFSTSARTISTGMAVTGVTREIRGARKVFEDDFRNAMPAEEMPGLIIHNEMVYAWKDRQDKLTDDEGNPATFDVDGVAGDEIDMGGTDPSGWTAAGGPNGPLPGVFNHRRHRVDRISFYARNSDSPYTRQTGDADTYIQGDTSPEAWIQYGLLRLADNSGIGYWKPGARGNTTDGQDEQGNHNNFFATQWAVGRRLMLLKDVQSIPLRSTFALSPLYGAHVRRMETTGPQPFNRESPPYPEATVWQAQESRVDMAGVTAAQVRTFLSATPALWWTNADTGDDRRAFDSTSPGAFLNYLPWAKPYVNKSNFANSIQDQTREMALMTPIFLRGCTQFIVEFAGDFYDQGAAGGGPEPLGTIDYVPNATTGDKIRWYGMPRETDGIAGITATGSDTRPLSAAPPTAGGGLAAKRFTGTVPSNTGAEKARTAAAPYVFAWGPTTGTVPAPGTEGHPSYVRPSLIRITMELMDPNGRLEDGQRIELVFRLKTPTFN